MAELLLPLQGERYTGADGDRALLAAALLGRGAAASSLAEAEAFGLLAAAAAPGDPRPVAFLARVYFPGRPSAAWVEAWRYLVLTLQDPWFQGVGLLRLGASAVLAAWAAALALLAAGLPGRARLIFHDYRDCFSPGFRGWTPVLLLVLIALTSWTAGVGPALFVLLLGLALAPYYPRRARWALGLSLGVGCLLGPALGLLSGVYGTPGERAWALYRVWKGDAGDALEADLRRHFPPDDARGLFARARVARRQQQLEEAALFLERALVVAGPGRALVHQELGTVRFLQGRGEEALGEFSAAAAADPRNPLPWLNRHILHLHRLELGLADEAISRAQALGSAEEARIRRLPLEPSRQLVPAAPPMPKEWVLDELLRPAAVRATWVGQLAGGLLLPFRAFDPALLGFLALGAFLPFASSGSGRRSHRCPSCGLGVCPRCGRRVRQTLLCPACWAAEHQPDADAAEKTRHLNRKARWQARTVRWVRVGQLVLPGWTGFLVTGAPAHLALGLVWAAVLGWTALSVLYPIPLLPWSAPGIAPGPVAVALAAHAVGAWVCLRGPTPGRG
ncbi:MAG: hypothetical protein ACNA8S_10090 [Deferrisomatales bacterium]